MSLASPPSMENVAAKVRTFCESPLVTPMAATCFSRPANTAWG